MDADSLNPDFATVAFHCAPQPPMECVMKSLLPLFAASLLSCASLHAGSLLDLTLVDRDTGATLSPLTRDGKLYVVGIPGHRYSVHMSNRTAERVMAVLSVDGVNAVSGETANAEQTGYVLAPYQSTEINGWRKSVTEVAQFNFTALSNSYAARTGRANNVGVIGVAVFREKQKPVWYDDKIAATPPRYETESARDTADMSSAKRQRADAQSTTADSATAPPASSNAAGAAKATSSPVPMPQPADAQLAQRAQKREESLGTGHGARESSNVSYTNFKRAGSQPNEVISIWYDSHHNLVARGVIPMPKPTVSEPQPFPQGFVPDPAS
jgi:hypothetical protein